MEILERENQLAAIAALLERARGGEGSVVLIAGEAGAGKTSLIHAAAAAAGRGVLLMEGACDPLSTPRPLGPLRDLVADPDSGFAGLLDEGAETMAIFDQVLERLRSSIRPILLIIEDIHWSDDGTRDLIRFLARRITATKAVLACTYRDDEIGPDHPMRPLLGELVRLEATTRVPAPMLSVAAVGVLAEGHPIDASRLHAITGGNAFFVTEAIAAGQALPTSVQDAVLARAAVLGAGPRRVIDAVSLSPRSLEAEFISAIADSSPGDIDVATQAGVLISERGALRFRHELARLAVVDAIPDRRRIDWHKRMLAMLMEQDVLDLARLAHHAIAGKENSRIVEFAPEAAREASHRGAHKEAVSFYEAALSAADTDPGWRAPLQLEAAVELGIVDRHAEAHETGAAAVDYLRSNGAPRELGNALIAWSRMKWRLPDPEGAAKTIEEGVAVLRQMGPTPELADAMYAWGSHEMLARRRRPALEAIREAVQLAENVGADDIARRARMMLGCIELVTGDAHGGVEFLREAAVEFAAHGEERDVTIAQGMLGSGGGEVRLYDAAIPALQEVIATGLKRDEDFNVGYSRAWLARIYFEQGRWDEAAETAQLTMGAVTTENSIAPLTAMGALGRVRVRRGDPGGTGILEDALALDERFELQHVWSPICGLAEHAWLTDPGSGPPQLLVETHDRASAADSAWAMGEVGYWMWRLGALESTPPRSAEPFRLQMKGDWRAAADAWQEIGCPYEVALSLADGDEPAMLTAVGLFDELGATPAAAWLRGKLRDLGVAHVPRGPTRTTRENPAGLTPRQLDVLQLVATGLSNAEIAERLFVSKKTVEHHVSAIYSKLDVDTRPKAIAAAARLLSEI